MGEEERFENLKKSLKWINEVDDTEIEDLWQKEILDKSAKKASKKSSKKSTEKNIGIEDEADLMKKFNKEKEKLLEEMRWIEDEKENFSEELMADLEYGRNLLKIE